MDEKNVQMLPHSTEAERAVLGAAFREGESLAAVMERIRADDFYLPAHKAVFEAMTELHSQGKPVDVVTVVDYLDRRGLLKEAGGLTYITDLPRAIPTVANLSYYLSLVEEKATRRRLIAAGQLIAADALSGENELTELLSGAEKQVFDISMKNLSDGLKIITDDVASVYMGLGEISSTDGVTGIPTGFVDLDYKLSGLQRSDLIIIAGRPSMGKTSFAINIAQRVGLKGYVVAVFSLEMSRQQLITRMMCSEAKVDMQRVNTGQLTPQDWTNLSIAMSRLSAAPFYIDDTAGVSVAEMRSKLRRLKLEAGKLDLVVIDYLQLMNYTGKSDNRTQAVAEITRALKIMARDLDVPIILLSQLSRAPEQRTDHRPLMSDLRESGSIEQDADIIIMLYRAAVYEEGAGNEAVAIVAKHRNGPTGDVNLIWNGQYTSFESATDRMEG